MAESFRSHHPPALTLLEKIGAAPTIAKTVFFALLRTITSRFGGGPPPSIQVQATILRTILDGFNWRQQVVILGKPTSATYKAWIEAPAQKEAGYENITEYLSGGGEETRLLWIGKPWKKGDDQRKIVIHFHGGGYVAPLNVGHLSQNRWLKEELQKQFGHDVSVTMLEYSTAPGKEFPTPLHQGVLALNHFLAAGCSPSNIALIGDSAGGNLALGILSHILHPYPGITKVLPLKEPLASVVLISPWVSFFPTSKSCKDYRRIDMITVECVVEWGELAIGGRERAKKELEAGRFHAEALFAPESWWKGLSKLTESLGITAGSMEILTDDIQAFHKKIKAESETNIDFLLAKNEVHDQLLIEGSTGVFRGASALQVLQWLGEGFKG